MAHRNDSDDDEFSSHEADENLTRSGRSSNTGNGRNVPVVSRKKSTAERNTNIAKGEISDTESTKGSRPARTKLSAECVTVVGGDVSGHQVRRQIKNPGTGERGSVSSYSEETRKDRYIKTSKKGTREPEGDNTEATKGKDSTGTDLKGTDSKETGSKGSTGDTKRRSETTKIDAEYRQENKDHNRRTNDNKAMSRSENQKNNTGSGTSSENRQFRSSSKSDREASDTNSSDSSDAELDVSRRHNGRETTNVRETSDDTNGQFRPSRSCIKSNSSSSSKNSTSRSSSPISNSSRNSSSRRSSSSRSNRSRSSSSRSNRSRRSSSRSNDSNSSASRSNSSRSSSCKSDGMNSHNRSQSCRDGPSNVRSSFSGKGAIPKERDNFSERHGSRSQNNSARENRSNNSLEKRNRRKSSSGSCYSEDERYNKNENGLNQSGGKVPQEFRASHHHNHHLPNSKRMQSGVPLEYEWQYRNDEGGWATYGQSGGNLPGSKMVTSNDIERYFNEDPDKIPLLIEYNNNKYILDFQRMKQTSQRTSNQREIRRVLKVPPLTSSPPVGGQHDLGTRIANGRNNTTGALPLADYSFNGANERGRGINNTHAGTNFNKGNMVASRPRTDDNRSVTVEWQVKDETGKWIAYGKANAFFDRSKATTSRSDDIEKAYSNKDNMPYFELKSNRHNYILDFTRMVQVNQRTQGERPIRRQTKESSKKSRTGYVGKMFGNLLPGQKTSGKESTTRFLWQFRDEHGVWITYGQPNSSGNWICTTSTTSDDIEKFFCGNSRKKIMTINSEHNQYTLDLKNQTQTNKRTSVQRPIRRLLKENLDNPEPNYNFNPEVPRNFDRGNNSSFGPSTRSSNRSTPAHVWQFEAESENWITYGASSSTVVGSGTNTASTDDIEEFFLRCNGQMTMAVSNVYNDYILDFQTMLQTNISTHVQRRIRRLPYHNNGSAMQMATRY